MEKLLVSTKTTCKCSPITRTVFNRATLFSTQREQPCPVKPVDTENAENKTRHPTTRGGLRLFTLSRGINTRGERVKNLGKNRAVTRFEWRAFTKSDSRGIVLIRIVKRVCSLARIVDCSHFSNFLVICNFCNSMPFFFLWLTPPLIINFRRMFVCKFCLNRYSILLYLL